MLFSAGEFMSDSKSRALEALRYQIVTAMQIIEF
jgi:hypothetical protein